MVQIPLHLSQSLGSWARHFTQSLGLDVRGVVEGAVGTDWLPSVLPRAAVAIHVVYHRQRVIAL